MKKTRMIAFILIVLLTVSLFAGCTRDTAADTDAGKAAENASSDSDTQKDTLASLEFLTDWSENAETDAESNNGIIPTRDRPYVALETLNDEEIVIPDGRTIKVGFCIQSQTNVIFNIVIQGMQAAADELGVEVQVASANDNVSTQVANIENFVADGFDAILIHAFDSEAFADAAENALKEGIVVAAYDDIIRGTDGKQIGYNLQLCLNNEEAGSMVGNLAADWLETTSFKDDEVIQFGVLNYPEWEFISVREHAAMDALSERFPNVEYVAFEAALYPEDGVRIAENWMIAYPDMKGVIAINDNALLGYYEAWTAAGKDENDPEFGMFGMDCIVDGIDLLAQGTILRGDVGSLDYISGYNVVYELVKEVIKPNTGVNVVQALTANDSTTVWDWVNGPMIFYAGSLKDSENNPANQ